MATPSLTQHELQGALGPILVDVRASGRREARPAVVIVHGFKGFKDWGMFPPLGERLARAGFVAVTPNLSGSGVDNAGEFAFPERFAHDTFSAELADTDTVMSALLSGALGVPTPTGLGLLGHSRGGGVAILAAARLPEVRSLVTWAAISTVDRWPEAVRREWRKAGRLDVTNARTGQVLPIYPDVLDDIEQHAADLDIGAAASRLTIPWLILHGDRDEAVAIAEAEHLASLANGPDVQYGPIRGGSHTFGARHPWAGATPELVQAMDASVAWFSRTL